MVLDPTPGPCYTIGTMKVGDLVRYAQEVGDDTDVGFVFEFHRGAGLIEGFRDIVHVRMLDGTEVVDSDHFFEVLNESR